MNKKCQSITDIFAEQRRQLLHRILERQLELKRAKEISEPEELTPLPGVKKHPQKRFALDDFIEKYPRRLKATKNRPPG
ncbi:hypothetical protein ABJW79_001006 [Escherichia coli]|nr:hypothetical protein [Escherichia coli]EKJ2289105.1 hypothetical protein [Escherichia coli]HAW0983129.1 hypothetical protein [Escherichia coli]HAW4195849.1 hypothetical protein [Escherichia coli]